MSKQEAWAVVDDGVINIVTMCPTKIGAMVNWLVVNPRIVALDTISDEMVEKIWKAQKGTSECVRVSVVEIEE